MQKKKTIIIASISIIVLAFIIYKAIPKNNSSNITSNQTTTHNTSTQIFVEIKGEVIKPNVYYIDSDARLYDLVMLAGGFTENAETTNINLTQKLTDGICITISKKSTNTNTDSNNNTKISINNASIEELMTLPSIGEAKAKSIINYRTINGNFTSIEDITKVSGISNAIFEQIKDLISL